jgi:radical SAM protein with 4Fe4S-binding SPASM domain
MVRIPIIETHWSNKCTGDCVICSKAHGGDSQALAGHDYADALIENLRRVDFDQIQVGGDGDSFLNEYFIPGLRKLRKAFPDKVICLYSNCSRMVPPISDILVKEKLLHQLQVRVDTINPDLYFQSTRLHFYKLEENLSYFLKINDFTQVTIIYFPLYKYEEHCKLYLNKQHGTHFKRINKTLLQDEYRRVVNYFLNMPRKDLNRLDYRLSGICLWGERSDIPHTPGVCTQLEAAFKNQIYIYPNGNIGLCPYDDGQDTFILGNMYHDWIDEVWEGERRKKFIQYIREGKMEEYPCINPVACGTRDI